MALTVTLDQLNQLRGSRLDELRTLVQVAVAASETGETDIQFGAWKRIETLLKEMEGPLNFANPEGDICALESAPIMEGENEE